MTGGLPKGDVPPMAPDPPQLKAHQISDSRSGTAYFVLVNLREDPNEFESSTIDVRVTDGKCCWSKQGMPCSHLSNHTLCLRCAFENSYLACQTLFISLKKPIS